MERNNKSLLPDVEPSVNKKTETVCTSATTITNKCTTKKTYRTRHKAGDTAEIPIRLPVITNHAYQYALTFHVNSNAYLQPLTDASTTEYKNGILKFRGFPATSAQLSCIYVTGNKNIEIFNLSLLRALYGIILAMISGSPPENYGNDDLISVYYPAFSAKTGKSQNIGKSDVVECLNSIRQFQSVVGIIANGTKGNNILPVIGTLEYNADKNTISFTSPYLMRIIKDIYGLSIRRDKKGNILLKKSGMPQMFPSHSYLVDMGITKEKNRKAVEIVLVVVALIEQAGTHIPHITAKNLVDRTPLLHKSMDGQPTGTRSLFLKRAFSKAWKLLREKTSLTSVYKNIQLPDPDDTSSIPTASTLDMVFSFPHDGKHNSV